MTANKVAMVIFEGGHPTCKIERDMTLVRRAIVCDNIEKFKLVDEIDPIIVVTSYPELQEEAQKLGAIVAFNDGDFHFGTRLKNIIAKYDLERVFYMGGASAPLITAEEVSQFAQHLLKEDDIVLTNNVQSSDLVAFTPAKAINKVHNLPADDNPLANLLRYVGLEKILMPHSVGIHFDIDTPADMLVLGIHPRVGRRTRNALNQLPYDAKHIVKAKHWLALPYSDVVLSGRVGSPVITQVNTYVRCRLRVYSEERGMKSLGRVETNQVQSLIAHYLDSVGPKAFFDYLAKIAQVAFIDSRVIFAHKKIHPSDNDRFYSDLFMVDEIEDPWVREFTLAAKNADLTVVLGGHSIVAGGMWALVDSILREQQVEFSEHKLYKVLVDEHSEFAGRSVGEIRELLPPGVDLYGVTRPLSAKKKAFTYIKPVGTLNVPLGFYLHLAGPREKMGQLIGSNS